MMRRSFAQLVFPTMMFMMLLQISAQTPPQPPSKPPLPFSPSPCLPDSRIPNEPQPQRTALMTFFNSLNGPNWNKSDSWGSSSDVCDWFGVSCCLPLDDGAYCIPDDPYCKCNSTFEGLVTGLTLPDNNLKGSGMGGLGSTLSSRSIAALECSLETLQLQYNSLSGTVPLSLSRLTRLQTLDMNQNGLTGSLPAFIGPLTQLQFIDLSSNRLDNIFPADFCLKKQQDQITSHPLVSLLINRNQISGMLDVSRCLSLSFLDGSSNNFSSILPPPGYNKLNIVSLSKNAIQDFAPLLKSDYLIDVNVDYQRYQKKSLILGFINPHSSPHRWKSTELAPTIPNLAQLMQIRSLSMYNTSLGGTLPAALFTINSLQSISLGSNYIQGKIPPISSPLQKLDLSYNALTGTIPQSMVSVLGYTTSFVNLKMNLMSCCAIGDIIYTISGNVYYRAYNYSLPRLPTGLIFSNVMAPYSQEVSSVQFAVDFGGGFYRFFGNLGNRSYPGLNCPYIMLNNSVGINNKSVPILLWYLDPEYYLFENCKCESQLCSLLIFTLTP